MKTILAALLALSFLGGLAGLAGASTRSAPATVNLASAEYDFPDFGTQPWWQQHQDMGG
jgi:hypothetical protein